MNDIDDVLIQARDSLSAGPVAQPPPVEAILARSRGQRHRHRLAGLSVAGVAGVTALALGLAGVFGGHSPERAGTTIRTAAFTLTKNTNGTDTLTLTQDQVFNPAGSSRHCSKTASRPWYRPTHTAHRAQPRPARPGPPPCPFSCPTGRP